MLVRIDKPDLSLLRGADYPGMVLMALFLGCLEYTLEEGPRWDWFGDDTIRTTAWISAIAGIAFVWRSLTFAQPVVDLRALKSRNFALGCFFSFVTGIGIFATIYLTPLFLGRVRGFSALQIGLAVFSTGIFQVCAIPLYTFCARRIDLRWLMMFGLACFALSMWNFTPITHDWGWRELLLPQALRGFAQQFAVAPDGDADAGRPGAGAAEARLRPVQPDAQSGRRDRHRRLRHDPQRPDQPAFPAAGRASATAPIRPRSPLIDRVAAAQTAAAGGDAVHGHAAALKLLWSLAMREAQTQTYADAFLAISSASPSPPPWCR